MGLLDDEGLGAAFGNEMLRRRATNERARMLARQQEPSLPPDINSSQFPRVNAAIQGLLGTAPDEMGISVLNPQAESIKAAADPAYVIGMALQGLPIVGGALKALGAGPKLAAGAERYMGRMGMMPQLDVYHGTPHRLPPTPRNPLGEFDASKIGTGEGAQVYGHGIYTAEGRPVAEAYASKLSNPVISFANKKPTDAIEKSLLTQYEKLASRTEANYRGQAVDELWNIHANPPHHQLYGMSDILKPLSPERLTERLEVINAAKRLGRPSVGDSGNLYKVDLPDEMIAKMLDWDKPLSKQDPAVRKMITESFPGGYINGVYIDPVKSQLTGKALLDQLSMIANKRNEPGFRSAETALRQAGIPGIKYLDATSRDAGKGTRNFVTFPGEEKKMTILERNGQGLTDEEKKRQLAGLLYP